MISYELAKKLKEAGWDKNEELWPDPKGDGVKLPFPTLSELIEAIKKETFTLWTYNKKWFCGLRTIMKKNTGCFTDTHTLIIDYKDYTMGDSPEEVVANLWLILNKK